MRDKLAALERQRMGSSSAFALRSRLVGDGMHEAPEVVLQRAIDHGGPLAGKGVNLA